MDIGKYMHDFEERQKLEDEVVETVEVANNNVDNNIDNGNSVIEELEIKEQIDNTEVTDDFDSIDNLDNNIDSGGLVNNIESFESLESAKPKLTQQSIIEEIKMREQPKELKQVEVKEKALAEQSTKSALSVDTVVENVQQKVLGLAKEKINSEKILDKHAESIAKITDKAMEVDAERVSLSVAQQDADNKVTKQQIRNQLIVLKAEAERLEKEQKQLSKEQKADHKRRNQEAKWEMYKDKLIKMKYSYVPNVFILSMLLFFDGVRSFFDGLGTVSTAIVKAFKWVILIGVILIVLFAIPVTRDWLLNLLRG